MAGSSADKALIPFEGYPVRPARRQGESLFAWVYRHYASNGLELPASVHAKLSIAYLSAKQNDQRRQALAALNALLAKVQRIAADAWINAYTNGIKLEGTESAWSVRQLRSPQFCPACLKEWGMHLDLWDLPGLRACPRHGCELLNGCSQCGTKLSWECGVNGFTCECGLPLSDSSTTASHPLWVAFSRIVASTAEVSLPKGYCFSYPDEGGHLPLCVRLAFLGLLVRTRRRLRNASCDPNKQAPARFDIKAIGLRDMRLLSRWPENARCCLRRLIRPVFCQSQEHVAVIVGKGTVASVLSQVVSGLARLRSPEGYAVAMTEIRRYCLMARFSVVLLANPHIYPEGCSVLLNTFAAWWQALVQMAEPLPEAISVAPALVGGYKPRAELAARIVRALIAAAAQGRNPHAITPLWRAWRPSLALLDVSAPETLPERIIHELFSRSLAELRHIALAVDLATGPTIGVGRRRG